MEALTNKEKAFCEQVWNYYNAHGREFSWRNTTDPYRILVSEIMLQQTQVSRVEDTYEAFLRLFPTLDMLSKASLGDVLRAWQGLGYNRRAKMLHQCATEVTEKYGGVLPECRRELEFLPGIGTYTAGAILVFAHGHPEVLIETNIRSVYIHYFFKERTEITDTEIFPLVERTCDRSDPRQWYFALMDHGVHIKRTVGNQNTKSRHYTKQSRFEGSDRQIRGGIVRELARSGCSTERFVRMFSMDAERIHTQLIALEKEGMIVRAGRTWHLAT